MKLYTAQEIRERASIIVASKATYRRTQELADIIEYLLGKLERVNEVIHRHDGEDYTDNAYLRLVISDTKFFLDDLFPPDSGTGRGE